MFSSYCSFAVSSLEASHSKQAYSSGAAVYTANTRSNNALDARNLGSHLFFWGGRVLLRKGAFGDKLFSVHASSPLQAKDLNLPLIR